MPRFCMPASLGGALVAAGFLSGGCSSSGSAPDVFDWLEAHPKP